MCSALTSCVCPGSLCVSMTLSMLVVVFCGCARVALGSWQRPQCCGSCCAAGQCGQCGQYMPCTLGIQLLAHLSNPVLFPHRADYASLGAGGSGVHHLSDRFLWQVAPLAPPEAEKAIFEGLWPLRFEAREGPICRHRVGRAGRYVLPARCPVLLVLLRALEKRGAAVGCCSVPPTGGLVTALRAGHQPLHV